MLEYLIVCPLVFIAGLVDAIAGGGGLISLPAYMIAGIPVHNALGTNKFSSCVGTLVTTIKYARRGMIRLRQAVPAVAAAIIAAPIGAKLALLVPQAIFTKVMLAVIPITAILVLRIKKFESSKTPFGTAVTLAIVTTISFVIGIYDGFYGPGAGTFLILLLVYLGRLTLQESAGLTKAINLTTNVGALAVFLLNGVVILPLALIAGVFGIAGNYLGASLFISRGKNIAKPIIIVVLTIFFCKLCYEMFLS